VYYPAIEHDGQGKRRKHKLHCFLHFPRVLKCLESFITTCNTRLRLLQMQQLYCGCCQAKQWSFLLLFSIDVNSSQVDTADCKIHNLIFNYIIQLTDQIYFADIFYKFKMNFAGILNTSTDMLVMNQSEDYRETQENRYTCLSINLS